MLPKYQELFLPLLQAYNIVSQDKINKKESNQDEINNYIIEYFDITEEEQEERTKQSNRTRLHDTKSWSISYLFHAGLLKRPSRGQYEISDLGKEWLEKFPEERINNNVLCILSEKFQVFKNKVISFRIIDQPSEWNIDLLNKIKDSIENYQLSPEEIKSKNEDLKNKSISEIENIVDMTPEKDTPDENLEATYKEYKEKKIQEIQEKFLDLKPHKFEELVIDVLTELGYGSREKNRVTKKTGDGGIDGIIFEDKLGLGKIGVQTKNNSDENTTSSEDIQKFKGALGDQGLSKGIFVTSSSFKRGVKDSASQGKSGISVVLIDGMELASIMFEKNMGVRETSQMKTVDIDNDFFNNYS